MGFWAAAGAVGSGLLGTAGSAWGAHYAWKKQKEAMQNGHQWEVADLRKAGLNPILSATGGSGASTGGLNVPQIDTSGISNSARAAFEGIQLENQLEQQRANIALTRQQTKQSFAATDAQWASARALNEEAESKQIQNSYILENPDVYDATMKGKVGNSIPGLAAIGEDVAQGLANSAKNLGSKFAAKFKGSK